jgi:hypothetical protein
MNNSNGTILDTLQLYLNSNAADRYNNNSNSDVEFHLPLIEANSQCYINLSVQNVSIPHSFYNCNSSNNILRYNLNSSPSEILTIVIPAGNYNVNTLKTYLANSMTGFTVSYNATTNKYTFYHNSSDFTILSSSTCLALLGFKNNVSLSSSSRTLTSTICCDFTTTKCILIASSFPSSNISKAINSDNNIIASFPVDVLPFGLLTYSNHNNYKFNTYANILSSITLRLTDQNGNLLDLNGCDWTITLQLDIIDYVN